MRGLVCCSCALLATASFAVQYHVVPIPRLSGITTFFEALGASTVVGSYGSNDIYHAFSWTPGGQYTSLAGPVESRASGINSPGTIVGSAKVGNIYHAAQWINGVYTDLGNVPGLGNSSAQAINDFGWAVGSASYQGYYDHAVLFRKGSVIDLGSGGQPSGGATAVNNIGTVACHFQDRTEGTMHEARYWTEAGGLRDMGVLGTPYAINDSNYAVGAWNGGPGFIWRNGEVTSFPTLSVLSGINNDNVAVGATRTGRGCFYQDGAITLIDDYLEPGSNWHISFGKGINDIGEILAFGEDSAGHYNALLLEPVQEPSALVSLVSIACFVMGFRCFRLVRACHS